MSDHTKTQPLAPSHTRTLDWTPPNKIIKNTPSSSTKSTKAGVSLNEDSNNGKVERADSSGVNFNFSGGDGGRVGGGYAYHLGDAFNYGTSSTSTSSIDHRRERKRGSSNLNPTSSRYHNSNNKNNHSFSNGSSSSSSSSSSYGYGRGDRNDSHYYHDDRNNSHYHKKRRSNYANSESQYHNSNADYDNDYDYSYNNNPSSNNFDKKSKIKQNNNDTTRSHRRHKGSSQSVRANSSSSTSSIHDDTTNHLPSNTTHLYCTSTPLHSFTSKTKYEIVNKIGTGTFSKVYSVKNTSTNAVVCAKVIRAIDKYSKAGIIEGGILWGINTTPSVEEVDDGKGKSEHGLTGHTSILALLSLFTYNAHVIIITPLHSHSLHSVLKQRSYKPLNSSVVRMIGKQVMSALDYLHVVCGVIHTDLKGENIVLEQGFDLSLLDDRSHGLGLEAMLRVKIIDFGASYNSRALDPKFDGVQPYIQSKLPKSPPLRIESPPIPPPHQPNQNRQNLPISTPQNTHLLHKSNITTLPYRSPEVIFALPWSYSSDIFSIGCVLVECLEGELLFDYESVGGDKRGEMASKSCLSVLGKVLGYDYGSATSASASECCDDKKWPSKFTKQVNGKWKGGGNTSGEVFDCGTGRALNSGLSTRCMNLVEDMLTLKDIIRLVKSHDVKDREISDDTNEVNNSTKGRKVNEEESWMDKFFEGCFRIDMWDRITAKEGVQMLS